MDFSIFPRLAFLNPLLMCLWEGGVGHMTWVLKAWRTMSRGSTRLEYRNIYLCLSAINDDRATLNQIEATTWKKSTQFLFQLDNYQEQKSGSRGVQCDKLFPVGALHWCATQKFWPRIASHSISPKSLVGKLPSWKAFWEKSKTLSAGIPEFFLMGIKVQNVQCTNFLVGILFQPLRVKLPCSPHLLPN